MSKATIVGAGLAGLSAAIGLAARGHEVTVFEAGPRVGGKVGIAAHDGVEFDTGPSLLTLPELIDDVFELAGTSLDRELDLVEHDAAFEYRWPDETVLDIHFELEDTRASVGRVLGDRAAAEFDDFMVYARKIWQAAAPNFIFGPAPSVGTMLRLGVSSWAKLMAIDPLNMMADAIENRVQSPKLHDVLLRYATYNGSTPFEAPATLNCIAWVDLGLGGWGVRGGMYEMIRALKRVADQLGVKFHLNTPVTGIDVRDGAVCGVQTGGGPSVADATVHDCDAAVVNADLSHLVDDLLDERIPHGVAVPTPLSMSGWTAIIRARRRPADHRRPHTVLFPKDYAREFIDIFERDRPPQAPTVYMCAQEKAHRRTGWSEHEPLFIMANAPAEPADHPRPEATWARLRQRVLCRLRDHQLIDPDDQIVWERTPGDLANRFAGTRGSIYGAASNSKLAAFNRAANRVDDLPGLYLASGSVHPGGGVPLCIQSGKMAADAAIDDLDG